MSEKILPRLIYPKEKPVARVPEFTKQNRFLRKRKDRLDPDAWAIAADYAEETDAPEARFLRTQAELFAATLKVIGFAMADRRVWHGLYCSRGRVKAKCCWKILWLDVPWSNQCSMRLHIDLGAMRRRPEYIRERIVNEVLCLRLKNGPVP